MRLMAIDFGEKRVGIASTDEAGGFALPRTVLPNDEDLINEVTRLADDWQVERIIVGESLNFKGEPNTIHKAAEEFARSLESLGKSVEFHPELLTSLEATRLQGENEMLDASAAALILKSYMDSRRAGN
jgi:putative Holliday junction resolvase